MRKLVGRTIDRLLAPAGFQLVPRSRLKRLTMSGGLAHLRALGVTPETVIDVGAAYGSWAVECHRVFPSALYLLLEPLHEFGGFLHARERDFERAVAVPAAAARESGRVTLHVHHDLVGSSLHVETEGESLHEEHRTVEAISVDDLVRDRNARPPYLLKVDVQGSELEVLAGAEATLAKTDVAIVEVSFFRFFVGGPEFDEVVAFLRQRGFVVYDILDPAYRPLDGALAQADVVFMPEASSLRSLHVYATPEQRREQDASFREAYERRRRSIRDG